MPATMDTGKLPRNTGGVGVNPMYVRRVDANGDDAGGLAYQLAGIPGGAGEGLAANTSSGSIVTVQRGDYIFDAQFAGSTSIQLEAVASDGVTWRTVTSLAASGSSPTKISLGLGSKVRLRNASATAATGLYASLT